MNLIWTKVESSQTFYWLCYSCGVSS